MTTDPKTKRSARKTRSARPKPAKSALSSSPSPSPSLSPSSSPSALDPGSIPLVYTEVRRRRLDAGISLDELGRRAALTPNYIGTVENGQRDPSLSTIAGLADGLQVTLSELFGPPPTLSPAALEMARLFNDASADMQTAALQLLRAILRQ